MNMYSVLFVCFGNVCRSPAAECLLRAEIDKSDPLLADKVHIESCGFSSVNEGRAPDLRMQIEAKKRGIKLCGKAQGITIGDFDRFDSIFVATSELLEQIKSISPSHHRDKIHLMTRFSQNYLGKDIPDPYHMGKKGFEEVMDMLQDVCISISLHLRNLGASNEET